jgi:hypothetical protein
VSAPLGFTPTWALCCTHALELLEEALAMLGQPKHINVTVGPKSYLPMVPPFAG